MDKFISYVVGALLMSSQLLQAQSYNYGEVLQKSLFFYEAQQSGPVPSWNRVSWRGDAFVDDGADVGVDLNGGWFDAGDHVKFGFPMAATVTTLSWGAIEYRDAYVDAGQLDILSDNLKFVTDYFLAAFINDTPGQYEFVAQVGDGNNDHSFWGPAEVAHELVSRASGIISTNCPGSDVAAETAAAMAAASIVFRENGDLSYANTLVAQAAKLYDFADTYRGKYSDCLTGVSSFYNSWSGFNDEIVWGAIWLYKATGDVTYLQKAEAEYTNLGTEPQTTTRSYRWTHNWDDKSYGCYVLMASLTGNQTYMDDAERWLDYWTVGTNGQVINYSPGGQAHLSQWGSLRYAANTSFLAFIYSDWLAANNGSAALIDRYHDFAVGQINYALGDNPRNSSYVVGFGNNPPINPHHRTAHGGWQNAPTGAPENNRHILYGALVGGPLSADDDYEDDRNDYIMNEVACDYNAGFQGAVARMYQEFGGTPLANFPEPEVPQPGEEYFNLVKVNAAGSTFTEVAVRATNHSAFPASVTGDISYKYYVDLFEGFAAGYSLSDYTVTANASGTASELIALDEENSLYYVEVSFGNAKIFPGGDNRNFVESQMRIALPNNAPASAWDPTNDFSYADLDGSTYVNTPLVPYYNEGVLLYGQELDGGEVPTARITVSTTSGEAPFTVVFDGADSFDPNGDALTYSWDFGDGTVASGVSVSNEYTAIGSYTAVLTVQDDDGNSDSDEVEITVTEPNLAPVATISATPISGDVPLVVSFDGSGSSDPNINDELSYVWDFGDGATSTDESPTHTYTQAGLYSATLTVSDGAGLTDAAAVSIEVIAVPNDPPGAILTVSATSGESPLQVTFDGSLSSDPDGDVLTYTWDFGDGTTGSGATVTKTYGAGNFLVTLTVDDGKGGVDSDTVTLSVTPGSCNLLTEYDVPRSTGLPTINNASFDYVHLLGTGGPDLSNVSNFTINWANESWGSGLWQMSFQTNNGVPGWWNDLRLVSSHSFAAAEPELTFSGSGFSGLDGTYYVNVDGGNMVIVATSGSYALYFSNSSTPPASCASTQGASIRLEGALSTYPNPSTSSFVVDVSKVKTREVLLYNAAGRVIDTFIVKEAQDGKISFGNSLEPGIYYIKSAEAESTATLRLVKK